MTTFIRLLVVVVNNQQTRSIMFVFFIPMLNIHKLLENSQDLLLTGSLCNRSILNTSTLHRDASFPLVS